MRRHPFMWIFTGGAAMVDYSMCCQTVTVYRRTETGIFRQVIPGCFFQQEERKGESPEFLLIQPGEEQLIFPGDRIFDGIGPEIRLEDWGASAPAAEASYARVYRWEGKFCHTEAGRN